MCDVRERDSCKVNLKKLENWWLSPRTRNRKEKSEENRSGDTPDLDKSKIDRQNTVLRNNLQDFILKSFLERSCSDEERQRLTSNLRDACPLLGPIYPLIPQADMGAERVLLSTLADREDFASVNAHHPHRRIHPILPNELLKHRRTVY